MSTSIAAGVDELPCFIVCFFLLFLFKFNSMIPLKMFNLYFSYTCANNYRVTMEDEVWVTTNVSSYDE